MPADFEISPLITPPESQTTTPAPPLFSPAQPVSPPAPASPPPMARKSNKTLKTFILIAAGLFVVTIGALWWGGSSFSDKDIVLTLEAPSAVTSGDEITYKITYKNNTKLVLTKMSFRLFYPTGSIVLDDGNPTTPESEGFTVERLNPGETQTKEVKVFLVGDKGTIQTARLNLIFNAGSLRSAFQKEVTASTTITALPVTLTLVAPPTTVTGQPVQYLVDFRNDSEVDLSDLKLVMTYPDGFTVQTMRPDASTGNTMWSVPTLDINQGKRITVTGILSGDERTTKTVTAVLQRNLNGQYVDYVRTEAFTVISSPLLSVTIAPSTGREYVSFPGDTLRYIVTYANNSRFTLLGTSLTVKLEGDMYDISRLQAPQGSLNDATRTIEFTSAGVPDFSALPPGKSGRIEFSIPLKPGLSGSTIGGSQSFYVKATSRFSTMNIPSGIDSDEIFALDSVITKIGSQPTLSQAILYDAPFGSGPYPPQVGAETVFTVRWQITNPGNDVRNGVVTASLPPGVTFKGNASTANGSAPLFNATTKTVTWSVGTVPFGTGSGIPRYEAIFQIAITPSSNQQGSSPKLVTSAVLNGTDGFTNQAVQSSARDVTTDSVENHSGEGRVQ